ncbi:MULTISPECIES: thioredoxin family protein [Mucilaginibacter]|jgi:thiol:disulfide interchange protein|uniref:Thioredoxin n=2 Tax=Mucilaginibacter TaxID=423349 RepID=A0AAE6JJH0_9SPHI|nr:MULTISPECIES: thioredoxin domain-containing protein [Mucilaginibacter]QEM06553.1 thioredoxin [Mucilaginibacter rubeus]QEM19142.1 thioredoxin [Mucilaginibacter gossypii]QTE35933.1 thioredoxin domain-containing protein [Mucilaginibacter gossypii]QTE44315.1 thioredoxin family protein [Mucilaginibacter rubeus]QTE50915.1 thioredoxin family protein [Mucilaginibacter rubeus]
MKKFLHINYFIIALVIVLSSTVRAQENVSKSSTQINFIENSWTEALKQAARQNKYIFVDAYATWCGPCKMLKATTFKNNKVADFYNDNFVNVAIDMEKGQGPALAAEWGLQAYPTMIIFTSKGKPVSGTVGYIRANDLIKFGRQALNK